MATFAERLNEALQKRNISAAEVSRRADIPESVMSQYKKGLYVPKQIRLDKLSRVLDVSIPWLMGADVPMDRIDNIIPISKAKRIPVLGKIACGNPILAQENWEELILLPENVSADFALRCQGNSMIDARINDGDIVYIKSQSQVDNGSIAAVLIDNEATLKRFYQQDNKVILQPENKEYQPLIYVGDEINDIRIIGKATYFLSKVE